MSLVNDPSHDWLRDLIPTKAPVITRVSPRSWGRKGHCDGKRDLAFKQLLIY